MVVQGKTDENLKIFRKIFNSFRRKQAVLDHFHR